MNKKDKLSVKLKISDIKVVGFSQFNISNEFDKEKFPLVEFTTNLNFRVIESEEKIVFTINVIIRLIETTDIVAELTVDIDFAVNPLADFLVLKEGRQEINTQLLINLATISVSTVRGILFEKLKGSIIQNEIYPLFNIPKLFSKLK